MTALAQRPGGSAPVTVVEPTPGELLSSWQRIRLILVLGTLIAVGPLTIDMYLPALPAISDDLQTTAAGVQLTLTGTLAGLAIGQLIIGPLSDVWGRRRPLLVGTALHVLASVLCAVAPNIAVLGTLRIVQGFGAAAAAVIAMAVVRDMFSGIAFARVLSRLLLVMGVAPVLAPTLGSALLNWTHWRGVFAALAVLGLALIAVTALGLPETLPPHRRRPARVLDTLRVYGSLFRDRIFVGLVLVAGFSMASLFAYVAGSSFVLQDQYGLDEQQFGIAFGAGAVGMITATQLNVRLLRRYSPQQILRTSLIAGLVCGLVLLGFAATNVGGLPGVLIPLWAVLAAAGFALPNAPALALAGHGEAAGTASAMLGAVQFGVGALAAPVVGLLGTGSIAMATVITGGVLAALIVLLVVVRPGRLPVPDRTTPAPVTPH
ncbi:DHA1 family bicyclomycin/chloramphenicol resistance-like MFS transporter [Micromonospora sp. Llam0]|uniref:multidrug effflux MFS transporter n=1 Tax=Micromonospora sp. Llam0 TaxID=2485143 RepID=UPI000F4637ED|nr:multidrug effflux MFS transporter [Micromonospora sp. Llam0]ROO62960.1 DHA1 family bicyclomycin/chloramphenicol resistance-like MFS transporter [Micromonospora sp. Llam0]